MGLRRTNSQKNILRICWTCLFLNNKSQGIRKTTKAQPESDTDFIGVWLRLFLLFWRMPLRHFSVLQKRVATRSVKKGLGIPNKQAQIRKPLRVCPACRLVKKKKGVLDAKTRQRKNIHPDTT